MNASPDAAFDPAVRSALSARSGARARQGWWVAGMLLVAVLVRCWHLQSVGLEHFDEGVYAFSGMWIEGVPFYTGQHYYAPPLLPGLIGVAYWLQAGMVSDLAAIAVSLAAGTVTAFVVWWVGRRWYGPAVGLAAGCLAALCDMHIAYSRMALTDVLLTMWLVLAIGCLREALRQGSFRWAVAAGVATALAWNTKYNGWLPLAIALVPLAWAGARSFGARTPVPHRAIGCWLVAAGIAMVGYLPWFCYVQRQPGGYLRLIEHHEGYVVGWSGWPASLAQQADNLVQWDGTASRVALPLAVLAASCCAAVRWRRHGWLVALLATALLGFALRCGAITVQLALAALLALAWCASHWRRCGPANDEHKPVDASAGLHGAWFVALLFLTPLYYPYARLALPWLPAVWLAAGAAIGRVVLPRVVGNGDEEVGSVSGPSQWGRWLVAAAAATAVGWIVLRPPPRPPGRTWQRTDEYRSAARLIAGQVPAGGRVLVYAEPPMLFYLLVGSEGHPGRHAQPLESLASLDRWVLQGGPQTYVVLGPQYYRSADGGESLPRAARKRLRLVLSVPVARSGTGGAGPKAASVAQTAGSRFDLFEMLPQDR